MLSALQRKKAEHRAALAEGGSARSAAAPRGSSAVEVAAVQSATRLQLQLGRARARSVHRLLVNGNGQLGSHELTQRFATTDHWMPLMDDSVRGLEKSQHLASPHHRNSCAQTRGPNSPTLAAAKGRWESMRVAAGHALWTWRTAVAWLVADGARAEAARVEAGRAGRGVRDAWAAGAVDNMASPDRRTLPPEARTSLGWRQCWGRPARTQPKPDHDRALSCHPARVAAVSPALGRSA